VGILSVEKDQNLDERNSINPNTYDNGSNDPKMQNFKNENQGENKEKNTNNKSDKNHKDSDSDVETEIFQNTNGEFYLAKHQENSTELSQTKVDKKSKNLTLNHYNKSLNEHTKLINSFLHNLSTEISNMEYSIKKLSNKIDNIEKKLQEYEKQINQAEYTTDEFIEIFGSKHPTRSVNINETLLQKVLEYNNERGLISIKNKSAAVNTALLIALYKSRYKK